MRIQRISKYPRIEINTHDKKWYMGIRFTLTPNIFTLRCGHWNFYIKRKRDPQADKGEWFK